MPIESQVKCCSLQNITGAPQQNMVTAKLKFIWGLVLIHEKEKLIEKHEMAPFSSGVIKVLGSP